MRDVWTVMWKEWKEFSLWEGGWVMATSMVAFVALVGVFLPWQLGPSWVEAPWAMLVWAWVPLFLVTTAASDTFAGERERRTLETLLATRLSSGSILLGKVGSVVLWGWAATMLCVPTGVLTVNLVHRPGRLVVYDPASLAGLAGVALVAGLLGASLGALVSLRARSVRQAQQVLTICVLGLVLLPLLVLRGLPARWTGRLLELVLQGTPVQVAWALGGFLALGALFLLGVAALRFRREEVLLR